MEQLLKSNIGKWVELDYISQNGKSKHIYGILKEINDDFIKLKSTCEHNINRRTCVINDIMLRAETREPRVLVQLLKNNHSVHLFLFSVGLIIFFLYVYRDLLDYHAFVYSDLHSFRSFAESLMFFRSTWNTEALGHLTIPMNYHFLFGLLSALFLNHADFAQKVFWLSLQPISAISMYIYLDRFHKIAYTSVTVLSSFFYALNPVSLQFFSIGVAPFLFLYAFLPVLMMSYSKLIEDQSVLRILVFSSILAMVGFYARDILAIVLPFVLLYIIICLTFRVSFNVKKVLLSTLICLGLYFLLSSSFYVHLFLTPQAFSADLSTPLESLKEFMTYTYTYATPNNLVRLVGGHLDWYPSIHEDCISALGYVFPILAFSSLLITDNKRRKDVSFFCILSISAITFMWLTNLGYLWFMFQALPILRVFRESYKLLVFLPLAFAPLLAFSLEGIRKRFL